MLRIMPILFTLNSGADISIIDSNKDSKYTTIIAYECEIPVLKTKLNDFCYILDQANKYCNLDLDKGGCDVP